MESAQGTIGRIVAVSVSDRKGTKKTNIDSGCLIENFGFKNDAHASKWHRQVSLMAMESIIKIREKGIDVSPGDFAENITTEGIRLWKLPIGKCLWILKPCCGTGLQKKSSSNFSQRQSNKNPADIN